jgi:hypothetical protein
MGASAMKGHFSMADMLDSTLSKADRQVSTVEFIQELFRDTPTGYIELTFISPPELGLFGPIVGWITLPASNMNEQHARWIASMNRKGYGCYYGLAVRGAKYETITRTSKRTGREYKTYPRGKAADATYLTCLWADIDVYGADGYTIASGLRPAPSVIISSGGGWHALWLFAEPLAIDDFNRQGITRALHGIAMVAGGDTHVKDLARVFRLVGTTNTKPQRNNAPCEVVDWLPDLRYQLSDFQTYIDKARVHDVPRVTCPLPDGLRLSLPKWVLAYLEGGEAEGRRNSMLFAATIEYRANGYSRVDADRDLVARAMADGLTEEETRRTMDSAWKSPYGDPNIPTYLKISMAAAGGES